MTLHCNIDVCLSRCCSKCQAACQLRLIGKPLENGLRSGEGVALLQNAPLRGLMPDQVLHSMLAVASAPTSAVFSIAYQCNACTQLLCRSSACMVHKQHTLLVAKPVRHLCAVSVMDVACNAMDNAGTTRATSYTPRVV